jgi:hypothetical protein
VCREHKSVAVVAPAALPAQSSGREALIRWIGLDVHVDLCEDEIHAALHRKLLRSP